MATQREQIGAKVPAVHAVHRLLDLCQRPCSFARKPR
jgi:hypothetical protein